MRGEKEILPGANWGAGRRRLGLGPDPGVVPGTHVNLGRMEGAGQKALHGPDDEDSDPKQVDFDQKGGEVGEVLGVAHRGLGHHHHQEHPTGPSHTLGHIAHVEADHEANRQPHQQESQTRVQLRHVAQRNRDALGHLLPRGIARMRTGPGCCRAGGNDEGQHHQHPVVQPQQRTGNEQSGRARPVVEPVTVHQHDGVDQQQHGGEEVHHDQIGIQLGVDDDPAQHGLGQYADDQASAEIHQVPTPRPPEDRPQERRCHGDGDDHGDQAVAEFHQPVKMELRGQVADRARGPVGASEATAGQAHRSSGHHDEGHQDQSQDIEAVAQRRGDRDTAAGRHFGQAYRGPPLGQERLPGRRLREMSSQAPALAGQRAGWSTVGAYVALTKPRIIELLLVTTLPTMVVAQRGLPSLWLMVATLAGGALAAGGANAINMVVDRDIDKLMKRTKARPLVTGAMTPRAALVFALTLEVAAFVELALAVNLLSAVLAVSATLFYVFVYTLWLKRRSSQNIVIGGAAGAVPVLVGWAAVTDTLSWAPVVLFAIIFIWTPPHFWSLAVRYKEDYAAADVPMLPVVASMKRTTREIVLYTVALVAVSLLFGPVAHLGAIYTVAAAVLGAGFLFMTTRLWRLARSDRATGREAMRVFSYSITYLTVLFVAMAGDVLIMNHVH